MTNQSTNSPEYYINRELSLLEFHHRVLKQSKDQSIPLLERLKFLFICSRNLDEFFEVRVAGAKQHLAYHRPYHHLSAAGLSPEETLQQISTKAHQIVDEMYDMLSQELLPALSKQGLEFLNRQQWIKAQKKWVKQFFENEIMPVVSPVALDIAHPFPRLVNKSLNFIVTLEGKDAFGRTSGMAIVHAPRSIPRGIQLPKDLCDDKNYFIFLTEIIYEHVADLFPGMTVTGCYQFRVTRNSDLFLDEEEIDDLALALKTELLARPYGNAVRLELSQRCPMELARYLLDKHDLTETDLYRIKGPVNLSRYMMLLKLFYQPALCYPPFTPGLPKNLKRSKDLFESIKQGNILLHHPYQSFEPVIELIREATIDKDVIAIKQTLYRTGAESQMVLALVDAARAGKEVTAVIELRARFDEASNIELATKLQQAGVLVVYGVVGYKTHAKMTLIVRRENHALKRYVHLGTGNYHASTAKQYTDLGYLTHDEDIGHDVQMLFHQLTGMGKKIKTKSILHSPFTLADTMISLIKHEAEQASQGKKAHIMARMNGLTDGKIIQALYHASQAGVKIQLIVRGICCLRPGLPGISDNISVNSVVGRFLEHSRVFYFYHSGKEVIYAGSADLMERNLYDRVEICFPITDKKLAKRVKYECLEIYLADTLDSWLLQADGSYIKAKPDKAAVSAQQHLLNELAD